jgi:Fe2+ transport system protein FeoA
MSQPHTSSAALATLSEVKRKRSGRIIAMDGGHSFRSKMYAMGLREGERVKVLQNYGFGPLVVQLGDNRIVLGRNMTERLWISPDHT